jgi:hypothetical protein
MIRASAKRKTPINTRFLGVPYILLDSEMNILLAFTTIWVMYNAYLTKDIGFLKQNILMPLIVK